MFGNIVTAIRQRMEAGFTAAPLSWPNEDYQPTAQQPWVFAEVIGNGGDCTGFNSPGLRAAQDDGLIQAHVFVPEGTGTDDAYNLAGAIGDLFLMATFSGTGCRIACRKPSVGEAEPGSEDGLWWRVSVSIPFTAFYSA